MRIGPPGQEIPVVVEAGRAYRLDLLTADIDGTFLASDGVERTRRSLAANELAEIDVAGRRVGSPIARPPAVLCIGQNYAERAAEPGAEPPTVPILFHKHPNTVVGPDDDVAIPPRATKADWEAELGVGTGGRAGCRPAPVPALEYVAGYVVSNDVSERTYQLEKSGGQWSKGKNAETFNPVGPWLVPAADIDPQALRLWSRVNGEVRQNSTTADMIFSVAQIIH